MTTFEAIFVVYNLFASLFINIKIDYSLNIFLKNESVLKTLASFMGKIFFKHYYFNLFEFSKQKAKLSSCCSKALDTNFFKTFFKLNYMTNLFSFSFSSWINFNFKNLERFFGYYFF